MNKTYLINKYSTRIHMLEARDPVRNYNIIQKLKRKIYALSEN